MYAVLFTVLAGLVIGWFSTQGVKTQWVRLLDVFILGPFLIYIAFIGLSQDAWRDKLLRILLAFFGATTISYNLYNYIKA